MGENDTLQISPLFKLYSSAICNIVSSQIKIKILKIIMSTVVTKTVGELALKSGFVDEILSLVFITTA
jgi:hypothetical protein